MSLQAFPKIWHCGSIEVPHLFKGTVEVTEKLDGSAIAFGRDNLGKFQIRSKGAPLMTDDVLVREPDKLFTSACNNIARIQQEVPSGVFIYGEVLSNPKHNTLKYSSVPTNNIAIYGVRNQQGWVSSHSELSDYARAYGFDVVPLLYSGEITDIQVIKDFLNLDSYLGGTKIEGVVIKNYSQQAISNRSTECYAKYVSEAFKEQNGANWKEQKDSTSVQGYINSFANEARWLKAYQFLRDGGLLTQSPKDIGPILKRVQEDLQEEEAGNIKETLYQMHIKQIKQASTRGLPEWVKAKLLESSLVVPV